MILTKVHQCSRLIFSLALGMALIVGVIFVIVRPAVVLAANCTVPGTHASIQAAIDDGSCDTITLSAQTYNESVTISRGVTLQGAGSQSTILQGNNTTRVMTITGMITTVHISDLMVTNGLATGESGGGISAVLDGAGVELMLENVRVSDNTADESGGGFYGEVLNGARLTITGSTFISNTNNGNTRGGGGFDIQISDNSQAYLYYTTIKDNLSNTRAGGGEVIFNTGGGNLTISQSSFMSNTTDTGGGGGLRIANDGGGTANAAIDTTIFHSNVASGTVVGDGGGLLVNGGNNTNLTATVDRSLFINNYANSDGGAFYLQSGSQNTILNTILGRNRADGDGAGIYVNGNPGTQAIIAFVTIADTTLNPGQAVYATAAGADVAVGNSILANHATGIEQNPAAVVGEDYNMFYNITTNTAGTVVSLGNSFTSTVQPFVDAGNDDYHINSNAEAINAGLNSLNGVTVTYDYDAETRPQGSSVDIGADEAAAKLAITKSAVSSGSVVTYTLTVENSGTYTASNAVITDTVPVSATYLSGGTLTGSVVSLPLPDIAPNGGSESATFSVTATTTITNDDYRVTADNNISATGTIAVVTGLEVKIYLPIVLKN